MTDLSQLLACPRCDKSPLELSNETYRCNACKIDFPSIDGIPWMFAEPQAALGEWRGRLQFAVQKLSYEIEGLKQELKNKELSALARRRVERYTKCVESHRRKLQKLLRPLDVQALQGSFETYLALRTRLPSDQGLNTYYANIHRDWAWGDAENLASLKQIEAVLQENSDLGNVLVLGAGAGRLAYDIHTRFDCTATVAMDFNPLLMLVAKKVTSGEKLKMYEFPIAPLALEDDAVLRSLSAPHVVEDGFHLWSERFDRQFTDIFAIEDEIVATFIPTDPPSVRLERGDSLEIGVASPSGSGTRHDADFGVFFRIQGDDAQVAWPQGNEFSRTMRK